MMVEVVCPQCHGDCYDARTGLACGRCNETGVVTRRRLSGAELRHAQDRQARRHGYGSAMDLRFDAGPRRNPDGPMATAMAMGGLVVAMAVLGRQMSR